MLGSYNSSSCIITPMLSTSNSLLSTNASLPSSCGRLLTRSKTFAKLREKYGKSSKAIDSVSKTRFGGTVINCSNNKNLLLEDASLGFRAEEEVLFELEKLAKLTHKLNPFWSAKY